MQMPEYEIWPRPKPGEQFMVTTWQERGLLGKFLEKIGLIKPLPRTERIITIE